MSQALSTIGTGLGALSALLGSRAKLRPASFRGVPFLVDLAEGMGGRRLVPHVFPLRDVPFIEDLGRVPRRFRLTAFVVDPLPGGLDMLLTGATGDWIDQRDALLAATEDDSTAATLVHPTMGEITCRVEDLRWREHIVEAWGYCEFLIEFWVDGPQASPVAATDTVSALLAGVGSILPLISAAYETVVLAIVSPQTLLGEAAAAMLGLPPGSIAGLAASIAALSASPTDLPATAAAVQSVTQAMAANVLAGQPTAPATDDPVAGQPFDAAPPADPSGGLATLAGWGAALQVPGGSPSQAAQQAAIVALIQGNATAALASVYAQTAFPSSNAATAARAQLLALLDAQTEAAAASGADDLYRGWRALTALAMTDMITRAQSLPTLAAYTIGAALPAVALAQLLYRDATRADQLAQLNDTPHPLFMAQAGVALSA